jgi:3-oxoacyl-[acyl-carrier protein] reductase
MKKRVLIIGASGGLGCAIAQRLSANGFFTLLHYHSQKKKAESILAGIRKDMRSEKLLCFDISHRAQTRAAITREIKKSGPFWGVVYSAGVVRDNPFPALSGEDWDQVLRTNLDGFYNVMSPVVMPMIQTRLGGRVIAISSVSGLIGNRGQVNYSAAEAGLIGAVKALSRELAKRNITVNSVAPGLISTDMTKDVRMEDVLPHIPMRRLGRPEEVAAAVNFLMTEEAGYITGQVLSINGGMA